MIFCLLFYLYCLNKSCIIIILIDICFLSSFVVMEILQSEREFLIFGLWVATIACLAGALLFAACSAVFAVINTATTPIGAVTGVPGLYLWNTLASK